LCSARLLCTHLRMRSSSCCSRPGGSPPTSRATGATATTPVRFDRADCTRAEPPAAAPPAAGRIAGSLEPARVSVVQLNTTTNPFQTSGSRCMATWRGTDQPQLGLMRTWEAQGWPPPALTWQSWAELLACRSLHRVCLALWTARTEADTPAYGRRCCVRTAPGGCLGRPQTHEPHPWQPTAVLTAVLSACSYANARSVGFDLQRALRFN
jgi:hypothetical protein